MAQNTSRSFIHIYLHRPATIHTSTQCDALILQKYTLQHRYIYFFLAFPRIFNSPATTACRNILIQGFLVKALRMVRKTSVQYSREHIAEVCVCVCVCVCMCMCVFYFPPLLFCTKTFREGTSKPYFQERKYSLRACMANLHGSDLCLAIVLAVKHRGGILVRENRNLVVARWLQ